MFRNTIFPIAKLKFTQIFAKTENFSSHFQRKSLKARGFIYLDSSYCQTSRASANLELTLFSPCHNNNSNKKDKKNKKNPHQNLPEGSKLKVLNFAGGLNLMEDDF